ncbi:MAG TPA: hypothetical protein VN703_04020 [Candidatus Sulfopaludibacter sp.]|jgi:hypothetical protein|nr:hypothetical protein [Candidatus Sulfopaludibacter sp.]
MHKKYAEKRPMVLISGSCQNFPKERNAIMELIGELEWGAHYESKCECSSDGKKVMGWDFFHIYIETEFIMELTQIHPKILKEEGIELEHQFVLWLEKQFQKRKKNYYLKLVEIPFEQSKGFRLNPENYRTEETLHDLR